MKKLILLFAIILKFSISSAQVHTERVMMIGRNALYFEDYVLAIQYFNQAINAKPYLAEAYYYRAMAKFMLDDFKSAEDDCTACLERNPYWTAAHQLRGASRQNQNKFETAAEDYAKSLAFLPEDKLTLVNMGIVKMEMKQFDEAGRYFDILLKRYPDYAPGFLTRAQMHLEKKDSVQAMADYDHAVKIDPYTAQSFSSRGLLYLQLKEYNKALADLDEAIRLDPYFQGNYINRGLVKYNLNDLRGAMADYDRVIEMDTDNLVARFNRGLLRAQVADNNRAIDDFNKVLQLEPKNNIAMINRALLNIQINNYNAALADLNQVLKEHPDFFQGIYTRSELKKKLGDMRGAERDYYLARSVEQKIQRDVLSGRIQKKKTEENVKATRETSDDDLEKFNMLVVADKKSENYNNKYQSQTRGKVQNTNSKVELEPRFVLSYYEKEREVQRPTFNIKAMEDANRSLGLAQRLRITNLEASLNEQQVQTHFRSIENLTKRIVEKPTNAALYMARALDYALVQDFENALNDLNKAIELQPNLQLAYFERAVIRSIQLDLLPEPVATETAAKPETNPITGKNQTPQLSNIPDFPKGRIEYAQIKADYDTAIRLNPDFYYAYYNRGEIFSLEKNYVAALADYDQAIQREPRFAEAYFNRGITRLSMGDKQRGLDDLRKAGELGIVDAYSIIKRMQ